jgi:omega-3 fatty acid desaturase (delta-15 desaturase)
MEQEFDRITEVPPFSLQDLRKSIPEKYWRRSTSRSIWYFIRDYLLIFGIYWLCYLLREPLEQHPFFAYIFFPVFWIVQGTLFWALFVVGHDCGHRHGNTTALDLINRQIVLRNQMDQ